MNKTVEEIAAFIGGKVEGDQSLLITSLATIESDQSHSLTFLANAKYVNHLYSEIPRAVLVSNALELTKSTKATLIRVDNVYAAYAEISHWKATLPSKEPIPTERISPDCFVDPTAQIAEGVHIGRFSCIEKNSTIGLKVEIGPQVFVGANVRIGANTRIMTGVKILDDTIIGANCVIYPNAVIGTDGFGHARGEHGHQKIAHSGRVIIEDEVEIGSGTVIDKGALTDTIIRKGVKLDNLIQVAHGVEIGEGVVMAAQSGIAGSTKVGKGSMIGGQVAIAGHLKVADGSQIAGKSGVSSDITEPNKKWYGYPILPYYDYLRSYAIFKRLPAIVKRIKED